MILEQYHYQCKMYIVNVIVTDTFLVNFIIDIGVLTVLMDTSVDIIYNLTTTGWDCRSSIWNRIQPTDWKGGFKRWWTEVLIQISVQSFNIDFQHKHVINSLHNGFSLWFTWKWDSLVEILSQLACEDLLATTVYTTHVFLFLVNPLHFKLSTYIIVNTYTVSNE